MPETSKRPVLYYTRILPSYRIPILECLNERLEGRLVVCAGSPPEGSSIDSLIARRKPDFELQRIENRWFRGETLHAGTYHHVLERYSNPGAVLIEESPRSVSLPFLIRAVHRLGAACALWGHFSSNNRPFSPQTLGLDRYRIALANHVEACVCYTDEIADMIRPFIRNKPAFVARNTLDTTVLESLYEDLNREGKSAVRTRLSLDPSMPTILFLGRLIPEKGTDQLLDVFQSVQRTMNAQLVIVGDGPERAKMQARVDTEQIDHVHFAGALPEWDESAPYIFASDLLLMPGYLGLAVNHALCFGVPVVSQAAPPGIRYHSPEVAFVEPDVTGILSPFGDQEELEKAVLKVLRELDRFRGSSLRYARQNLSMEVMVDGLEEAVRYLESLSPIR